MADSESNIPTLVDIAHQGNAEMLNHFDAHQFEKETDETKSSFTVENSNDVDNIPSIKVDDKINADLATDDFSDAMQSATNKTPVKNSGRKNIKPEELKEKIDLAIKGALPGIELQLKKQLYKQFDI
jgi:hypothetical protein